MRARMALTIAGVSCRLWEIVLRDKPDEMLALSPKGTVPVLQLADGAVLDESLEVMAWALGGSDPEGWMTPDAGDRDEMLALIAENDGPFKHHLDRYKYSTRYEDADPSEHRAAGEAFLKTFNDRISQYADDDGAGGYLFGRRRALADIAIFPFVRQFRIADPDWFDATPYGPLRVWLEGLTGSELFASVMSKYPLWKQSGEEHAFP